jgi:putative transcriptional regulator
MAIRVRLKDVLKERGMSQVELQHKTGLSYSAINELCHAKTESVRFRTLDALCVALSCDVGDLLVHTSERKRSPRY